MKDIFITKEPIELFIILILESLVGSGGEAKYVISEGLVKLNGDVETRKRKKIVSGDTIEFNEEEYRIQLKLDDPAEWFKADICRH